MRIPLRQYICLVIFNINNVNFWKKNLYSGSPLHLKPLVYTMDLPIVFICTIILYYAAKITELYKRIPPPPLRLPRSRAKPVMLLTLCPTVELIYCNDATHYIITIFVQLLLVTKFRRGIYVYYYFFFFKTTDKEEHWQRAVMEVKKSNPRNLVDWNWICTRIIIIN